MKELRVGGRSYHINLPTPEQPQSTHRKSLQAQAIAFFKLQKLTLVRRIPTWGVLLFKTGPLAGSALPPVNEDTVEKNEFRAGKS